MPFLPWRLDTALKSASEELIGRTIRFCGKAEFASLFVVASGLAVEVFVAWKNPVYGTDVERIGPLASDILVFAGVVAEYFFGNRSSSCQEELTRRSNVRLTEASQNAMRALHLLALANERAAKMEKKAEEARERTATLELELANLRQPRMLSDDAVSRIIERVRPFTGTSFDLAVSQDSEAIALLDIISAALIEAGWVLLPWSTLLTIRRPGKQPVAVVIETGISVQFSPAMRGALEPAVLALTNALLDEGISARPEQQNSEASPNANAIHVAVGRKP